MAGTIKLDGTQFLEKVNNEFKITNSELKLKSTGNTIVDSSGNAVVSESGGNVTLGNVRLPATGGIKDSSGNNILTESGGNVTLGNATLANTFSLTDEYYLQGRLNATYSTNDLTSIKKINFDGSTSPYWVLTGDTTNFVQGTTISDLKIIKTGIYLVNFCSSCGNTSSERGVENAIYGVGSGSTSVLEKTLDSISYVEGDVTYGSGTVTLVYKFNANDQISFGLTSGANGDANIMQWTHFNICLIRPL